MTVPSPLLDYSAVVHVAFAGDAEALCGHLSDRPEAELTTEPGEATCDRCIDALAALMGDCEQTCPPPCPVEDACQSCGSHTGGLDVYEADTDVGVVCLTVCARCVHADRAPRLSCPEAARRVIAHCGHTGIDPTEQRALEVTE